VRPHTSRQIFLKKWVPLLPCTIFVCIASASWQINSQTLTWTFERISCSQSHYLFNVYVCMCVCVYVCMCVCVYLRANKSGVDVRDTFRIHEDWSCWYVSLLFSRCLSRATSLSCKNWLNQSGSLPLSLLRSTCLVRAPCLYLAHTLVPSSLILPGHLSLSLPPAIVLLSISLSVPLLSPSLSSPAPSLASSFSSQCLFLSAKPLILPGHLVVLIRLLIFWLIFSSPCDHLTFPRSKRISPSVNKGSWAQRNRHEQQRGISDKHVGHKSWSTRGFRNDPSLVSTNTRNKLNRRRFFVERKEIARFFSRHPLI